MMKMFNHTIIDLVDGFNENHISFYFYRCRFLNNVLQNVISSLNKFKKLERVTQIKNKLDFMFFHVLLHNAVLEVLTVIKKENSRLCKLIEDIFKSFYYIKSVHRHI